MKRKIRKHVRTQLWKLPNGYADRPSTATMLELFYDLVIVAALGGVTHSIITAIVGHNGHPPVDNGHLIYTIIFNSLQTLAILLLWKISTFLSTRFNLQNQRNRLFVLIQMIGFSFIVAGTYSIDNLVEDVMKTPFIIMGIGYAIILVSMTLHVTLLYFNATDKYIKKQLFVEIIGRLINILIAVLWYLSLSLGNKYVSAHFGWNISIVFWALNILAFMISSWLTNSNKLETNTPDLNLELIQERFSILYIVFLGEALVQIITSSAGEISAHREVRGLLFLVGGMVSTYILWWLFNDLFNFPDIIERPEAIHMFASSMIFMMFAFIFFNVGYSLFISGEHNEVAGYMMVTGAVIWHTAFSPAILSVKVYKRSERAIIPLWARKILEFAPVGVWIYAWSGIVFPEYFIYVMLSILLLYGAFMYLLSFVVTYKSIDQKFEFEAELKKYKSKDEKWIKHSVIKYIDEEHHNKYNFKLNRYSQYFKKSA